MCVCIKLNPTLESERQKKREETSLVVPGTGGGGASATYLGIPIVVHDDKV